jgi:hypothetical protein
MTSVEFVGDARYVDDERWSQEKVCSLVDMSVFDGRGLGFALVGMRNNSKKKRRRST